MTQQNAALVEQAAAAAESMRDQSISLSQILAQFKLAGQDRDSRSAMINGSTRSNTQKKPVVAANKPKVLTSQTKKVSKIDDRERSGPSRPSVIRSVNDNDWEEF